MLTAESFEINVDAVDRRGLVEAFLDKIKSVVFSFKYELPPRDEFLKLVKEGYDKFIAPIDMPYVPNVLAEPWLDKVVGEWVVFRAGILYDQLSQES